MRGISVLGATGSIGRNTLAVAEMFPDRFTVAALTANANIAVLADQILRFHPDLAVVGTEDDARALKNRLPTGANTDILYGVDGYIAAATHDKSDIVVSAMVGAAGLMPTLAAIDAGKLLVQGNVRIQSFDKQVAVCFHGKLRPGRGRCSKQHDRNGSSKRPHNNCFSREHGLFSFSLGSCG